METLCLIGQYAKTVERDYSNLINIIFFAKPQKKIVA